MRWFAWCGGRDFGPAAGGGGGGGGGRGAGPPPGVQRGGRRGACGRVPGGVRRVSRGAAGGGGGGAWARMVGGAGGRRAGGGTGRGWGPARGVRRPRWVMGGCPGRARGLGGRARRTLRTNLRFLARVVVPQLVPADAPLPRERAKAPYAPAEISGFLALADAQPTAARPMRAAALVCLGAGAGLIRSDLRQSPGTDVTRRPRGGAVPVRGRTPPVVPALGRAPGRPLA